MEQLARHEAAVGLRQQAACCRKLAVQARTDSGSTALRTVAEMLDDDARRIDPTTSKID
jgi:hypothetical protein